MDAFPNPAALPAHVLERADVQQALARRDFGEVFRLARKWGGISFSKIAEACDIKSERVGALARGEGAITTHDKILQVCDALRIPGHTLGLLPRPWETTASRQSPRTVAAREENNATPPAAPSLIPPPRFPGVSAQAGHFGTQGSEAEAVHAFRMADRQVGGGHLYAAVMQYLSTRIGPGLVAESSTPASFVAAAGLTEMAGWMAHDSGRDAVAARHFHRALNLASAGEAAALTAQVWASRAHLALHRADNTAALVAADQAWQHLDGSEDTALRGRVLTMRARAHAVNGDGPACRSALAQAERLLSTAQGPPGSEWTSPFDSGSLASEAARSMCDVGDYAAAVEHAHLVMELRGADRVRARALASLTLARALIGQGHVDGASAIAQGVGRTAAGVGSLVVSGQLSGVANALAPYEGAEGVGTVLAELRGVLTQHRGMYHWLGDDREEGAYG
ncbi:transcriptional regulator with XRE-family HTH domain [Nocardiopsis sp. Huas11]|uniref:helix-turn-helix domain-containing protein n=1 Tax=Nocardiopsis sp. Huas11 TaxID=2183912 RepID=UPI000F1EB4C3|nr:helix-turn-helix domain-containing protein [Nocardiopsis sp. Huas11]RKS07031.1 transcriptional regulator with XRE-family HTH domain [Nocardiopsis sp. Huas11]